MTEHRPGQWPGGAPRDPEETPERLYVRRAAEQARREMVLGSIKAHLGEQPSRSSVLSAARRWCADIMAAAYEIAKKFRSPG